MCYKRVVAENKFYADAYIRLANLKFSQGNTPRAIQILSDDLVHRLLKPSHNATTKKPSNDANAIISFRGWLLQNSGDFEGAKKQFKRIAKFPSEPYARLAILSCNYQISLSFRNQPLH